MKKLIIFILFVSASTYMISCTSSTYEEISAPVTNPTYTANIGPIIKANCSGCHSGGQQTHDFTNYAEVKDGVQNGEIICRIDQSQACGRVMPQSGAMSQQTIDMFILWQTQGCIN